MTTLTGTKIANTYKDLLQVSNSNSGIDATLRTVSDGEATNSPLQLSQSTVNINGTFALNGISLTVDASTLNYLGGGAVNPSFGTVSVSTGLDVDGYATFQIVSAASGAFSGIVSAASFAGAVSGTTGSFSSQVSGVGATWSGPVSGTSAVFSGIVSASGFAGDGSALTGIVVTSVALATNVSGGYGALTSLSSTDIRGATGSFTTGVGTPQVSATTNFSLTVAGVNQLYLINGGMAYYGSTFDHQGSDPNLSFQNTNGTINTMRVGITTARPYIGTFTSVGFDVMTNGVARVTYDVSGSVGIGTTTPGALLDVNGKAKSTSLEVTGVVSGNSAVFSGVVSAASIHAGASFFTAQVSGTGLTLSGIVSGTSAVFSGIVSAASFAGAVSGTTGNFSSQVSAAGLTLSGVLSATSGVFSGQVSGAGASFSGVVSGTTAVFSGMVSVSVMTALHATSPIVTLTDGTSIAVNFNAGQNFMVSLGGNRTLESGSNVLPGQTGSIFLVQDGTGSRTLSYGANWKFPAATAPTLTTTASAIDRLDYIIYGVSAIHAVLTKAMG